MNQTRILAILSFVFVLSIASVSLGIAYAGGVSGIGILGILFFLTFGIVVVLAQLIPAAIILSSLVGVIVSPSRRGEVPIRVT
jgi:hypothetical protein